MENLTSCSLLREKLALLAHLRCRIRTLIQTGIRSPNPLATLHYAEMFTLQESDSDSNPNCNYMNGMEIRVRLPQCN